MLPPPWRIKKEDSEGFYWKYFFLIKIKPALSERYFKQNTQSRAWNRVSLPGKNLGNMGQMRERRMSCVCVCVISSFCCFKHTCSIIFLQEYAKKQQTCVFPLFSSIEARPFLFRGAYVLLHSSRRGMKSGTQSGVGSNQSTAAEKEG